MTHNNTTTLYSRLRVLSGVMLFLAAMSFAVPIYNLCWNGDTAYNAAHLLASYAFTVAVLFAFVTLVLFFRRPYDFIVVQSNDEHPRIHSISISVFAGPFLLIVIAVATRIAQPKFLGLAPEGYYLVASTIVAFSLVVLDITLIWLCRRDRLRSEWLGFATEACKLDAGVFASFVAALLFVAAAVHHVSPNCPNELKLVVFGIEAALLTVSTVAFSFDSGGLLKPKRLASALPVGSGPPPVAPAIVNGELYG